MLTGTRFYRKGEPSLSRTFYVGGSSSIRGFERLSLGPANQTLRSIGQTPREIGTYLEGNVVSSISISMDSHRWRCFHDSNRRGRTSCPIVSDYFSVVGWLILDVFSFKINRLQRNPKYLTLS